MALSTTLARLRARIKKELDQQPERQPERLTAAEPTAAPAPRTAAPISRSPARRPESDPSRDRTAETLRDLRRGVSETKKFVDPISRAARAQEAAGPFERTGETDFQDFRAGERGMPAAGDFASMSPSALQQVLSQFPGMSVRPDNISSFLDELGQLSPDVTFSMGAAPTGLVGSTGGASGSMANTFGTASQGLGGLSSALGLAQGIQKGDPIGSALSAYQLYSSLNNAFNLGGPTASGLVGKGISGLSSLLGGGGGLAASNLAALSNPGIAAALGIVPQAVGSGAGTTAGVAGGAAGSLAGSLAGVAGVALPVVTHLLTNAFNNVNAWTGEQFDYQKFVPRLMHDQGKVAQAQGMLAGMLPYAQDPTELNAMLDFYTKSISGDFPTIGGGPGRVPYIAPTGSRVHGQNINPFDTSVGAGHLQNAFDYLGQNLQAGGGGGRDIAGIIEQLRGQYSARTDAARSGVTPNAPSQSLVRLPDGSFKVVTQAEHAAHQAGILSATDAFTAGTGSSDAISPDWVWSENVFYGDPRYNYASQGIQDPNWTPGPQSAAWQSMMSPRPTGPATAAPTNGMTPTAAGPALPQPASGVAPLGSSGFASLKGPRSELLTADDPTRL